MNNNVIVSNTASIASDGEGGGLNLDHSPATLSGNTVQGNTAGTVGWGGGGGLSLDGSDATLSGNTIVNNIASIACDGMGGGLSLSGGNATLSGNTVVNNIASVAERGYGGGVSLSSSATALSNNVVLSNTATLSPTVEGEGGGLYVYRCPLTLTNNLVAGNHANTRGSGLWFEGSEMDPMTSHLLHTTVADNRGSGQGVFVGGYTSLAFSNTIIVGHSLVGITVTAGSTVTLEATLWHDNASDTGGTVISSANYSGDPAFVDAVGWDYHLAANSAAIDRGVDAGVTTDIDGDPRPMGAGYDIGADEAWCRVYLPLVLRNQ